MFTDAGHTIDSLELVRGALLTVLPCLSTYAKNLNGTKDICTMRRCCL